MLHSDSSGSSSWSASRSSSRPASRILLVCIVLIGMIVAAAPVANAFPSVAVVPFDNTSGRADRQLGRTAAELLQTRLAEQNAFDLVERSRLDAAMREIGMTTSGLTNQEESYVRLGELITADFVVTGAITEISVEERRFEGYGVTSTTQVHRLSLSVRCFEASTGRVRFGEIYDVESEVQQTSSSSTTDSGVYRDLVRQAVERAAQDLRASGLDQVKPPDPAEMVEVRFRSSPAGAAVKIDGIVVGTAPLALQLPAGIHRVEFLLDGYLGWDQPVQCDRGTSLSITLHERREPDVVLELR